MYKQIILCLLSSFMLLSCVKDDFNINKSTPAPVPVDVPNRVGFYNGVPYVQTSVSGGGNITITLAIPESSGRKIKEISRVGTSTSIQDYRVVQSTTIAGANYISSPIPAGGTSVNFTTSLTEYTAKTGGAPPSPAGTNTSFLGRYFYFMLTLDNGDQLIAVPVRVYVNT